jgi:hypothetical protein
LSELNSDELNSFVLQDKEKQSLKEMPASLRQFVDELDLLNELSRPIDCWEQTDLPCELNLPGLTAKKCYEIQHLVPFVHQLCLKHQSYYLIDIGSGLVSYLFIFILIYNTKYYISHEYFLTLIFCQKICFTFFENIYTEL